jgi:hypothetical protein
MGDVSITAEYQAIRKSVGYKSDTECFRKFTPTESAARTPQEGGEYKTYCSFQNNIPAVLHKLPRFCVCRADAKSGS